MALCSCSSFSPLRLRRKGNNVKKNDPGSIHGDEELKTNFDMQWEEFTDVNWEEFTNVKFLAQGNFARVHSAEFKGRRVAVKVMRPDVDRVDAQKQFDIEISIMRDIKHKNIVRFYGGGTTSEQHPRPFIILELMEMGTLQNLLENNGFSLFPNRRKSISSMKLNQRLEVVLMLAEGLHYLQEVAYPDRHILHRDLKPHNFGWTANGCLKIMDFGLATTIPRNLNENKAYCMTGETGTVRYMPPEVALGKPYNEKSDVYSFALIAWQVLTGCIPYGGFCVSQLEQYVFHEHHRPSCPKKWPQELLELLEMCWSPVIEKRPSFSKIVSILSEILCLQKVTPTTAPTT